MRESRRRPRMMTWWSYLAWIWISTRLREIFHCHDTGPWRWMSMMRRRKMNRGIGRKRRGAAVAMEWSSPRLPGEKDLEVPVIHMELKLAAPQKETHILAEIQILRLHISQDKNAKAQQDLPQQVKQANQKQAQQEATASQRRIRRDLTQLTRTTQSPESPWWPAPTQTGTKRQQCATMISAMNWFFQKKAWDSINSSKMQRLREHIKMISCKKRKQHWLRRMLCSRQGRMRSLPSTLRAEKVCMSWTISFVIPSLTSMMEATIWISIGGSWWSERKSRNEWELRIEKSLGRSCSNGT